MFIELLGTTSLLWILEILKHELYSLDLCFHETYNPEEAERNKQLSKSKRWFRISAVEIVMQAGMIEGWKEESNWKDMKGLVQVINIWCETWLIKELSQYGLKATACFVNKALLGNSHTYSFMCCL